MVTANFDETGDFTDLPVNILIQFNYFACVK